MSAEPIEVAACVIRRGHEFLISRRNGDEEFAGFWEFPGGKKNAEETLEETARREALEEIGMEIRVEGHLKTLKRPYPDRDLNLNFFLCKVASDKVFGVPEKESIWVKAEDLDAYRFPPANQEIVKYLQENRQRGQVSVPGAPAYS